MFKIASIYHDWQRCNTIDVSETVGLDLGEEFIAIAEIATGTTKFDPTKQDLFGSLGEATCLLGETDFWFLLPLAVHYATKSEEPVFASTVVRRVVHCMESSCIETWQAVLGNLPNDCRGWLVGNLALCVEIGWEDPKRKERIREALSAAFRGDQLKDYTAYSE